MLKNIYHVKQQKRWLGKPTTRNLMPLNKPLRYTLDNQEDSWVEPTPKLYYHILSLRKAQ